MKTCHHAPDRAQSLRAADGPRPSARQLRLTLAERKAMRQAVKIGCNVRQSVGAPKIWFHGYISALRAVKALLPSARYYAAFHRRMDRIEKKFALRTEDSPRS